MHKKLNQILTSDFFLIYVGSVIFLLSILLRSTLDIGGDTGVYIDLGKKISNGGRYYYDFFESNFPLSFYFYALQYQLASLLNLNQIILSEVVINLLALLSIFYSAKILRNTTINQNKAHYNLIVISYLCGFFLRPEALQIGEFGTKTSLLLIVLYPYISFSFERLKSLTKSEMICRGLLMGLMPCIKPHYLLLIAPIEIYRFFQKRSLSFFYELDKLTFCFIGSLCLFLMLKFTPEYFEFIVPMWPKIYLAYDNYAVFLENVWRHIAARVTILGFIFLMFSRLKFEFNDKILALLFMGASLLIVAENIGTVDQVVIFYAIITICFSKFIFDLLSSKEFSIVNNRFIIISLIFIPIFDLEILPASIFSLGGFINIWWMILPIYPFLLLRGLDKFKRNELFSIKKVIIAIISYFTALICAILILKEVGGWAYISFNLSLLFIVLFLFEKRFYSKFYSVFSPLFVFVVTASISCFLYAYVNSFVATVKHDSSLTYPNKFSDFVAHYSKIHAPEKGDSSMMSSSWIAHKFPLMNYLEQNNYQKYYLLGLQADIGKVGSNVMFPIADLDKVLTLSYLFDDAIKQLKDPRIKIIFINNTPKYLNKVHRCLISNLEYYFLDPEFKKLFLQNFHFENRVIIQRPIKSVKKIRFITGEEKSIFDQIKPSKERVSHDFEVYVRNEKK